MKINVSFNEKCLSFLFLVKNGRVGGQNYQLTYENVFTVFVDYCNSFSDKLNLVGLSLGGILAIDYAILHPEKVNSITLCGVPYEIPRKLLKIQNFIFKLMPKRTFENIDVSKENFIQLTNSMAELNIKEKNIKIKMPYFGYMWRKRFCKYRECK